MGSIGWEGDAVSTPSCGTMIAALPRWGHIRLEEAMGVVEEVDDVDDVDDPGVLVGVEVDVVGELDEVVVVVPDVGELAPMRKPTINAPSARGMSTKRPNLDGNDAFTFLIYMVAHYRSRRTGFQSRVVDYLSVTRQIVHPRRAARSRS